MSGSNWMMYLNGPKRYLRSKQDVNLCIGTRSQLFETKTLVMNYLSVNIYYRVQPFFEVYNFYSHQSCLSVNLWHWETLMSIHLPPISFSPHKSLFMVIITSQLYLIKKPFILFIYIFSRHDFKNLIVRLHIFIIFFMFSKFKKK